LAGLCPAGENLLQNGSFDQPDNIGWSGSEWSIWTAENQCGREPWAERTNTSGRGAAAYGWNSANEMGIYQDASGAADTLYVFSVWVKKEVNYNEAQTELKIEWLDDALGRLGGDVVSNITGQAGTTYTKFTVTGSSTNAECAVARIVIHTQWNNPAITSKASMQFDDVILRAYPATVIQVK
jgi:hypothetical protein